MTKSASGKTGVELCSCGSGREARHCCGAVAKRGAKQWLWPTTLLLLTAAALVAVLVADFNRGRIAPGAAATPEPWEYNPGADQHWDPAHGHWHDGPPPPESER